MSIQKIALNIGKNLIKKSKSKTAKKIVDATSDSLFSFAKKHHLFSKAGELVDDGLALVHMTDFVPKTGKILTDRAIFNGTRNSIHTSLNHAVCTTNIGLADWTGKKFAIIMPFSKTVKANEPGKFIAGMTSDLWTNGSLKIPKGAVIVRHSKSVPQGKLRIMNAETIKKFKNLKGVRIIETSEQPHASVKKVLKKMGYSHIENPHDIWGGFGSKEGEKLIEEMKIWNVFAKKHGIVPALHSASPNARLELLSDCITYRPEIKGVPLQILREGKVVIDYKKEILKIISECKTKAKTLGIPTSFDVDSLEKYVKESKNFKDIYDAITKKLKLKSLFLHNKITKNFMLMHGPFTTDIEPMGALKKICSKTNIATQSVHLQPSVQNLKKISDIRPQSDSKFVKETENLFVFKRNIEKLKKHPVWETFSPEQKAGITIIS